MSQVISVLWQSDIGQITLISFAYSLFGVLLVGGYLSYFAGGFSVIADLSLQDILFFVPSFVAGFSELVWREGTRWMKKIFQWAIVYVVGPFITGLLLTMLLYYFRADIADNKNLFSISFVLWTAGLEVAIWASQRRKLKVLGWLLMVVSVMLFSFSAPRDSSGGETVIISPVIDREVMVWSMIIEFFLLPMIVGREIARILFEQRKLLKVEECNTRMSIQCNGETFLVAFLRKWVILYILSGSGKGKLLLLPSEEVISFILGTESTKEEDA